MDYFIHKDLGAFLRRELDFYIKNEVMRLDDIENADVPAVESYLAKIKVLRQIAGKLIDFLAQLENFQKKLWLKKKFVVADQLLYHSRPCSGGAVSRDRRKRGSEHDVLVRLFAIDEIEADLANLGYSKPLTIGFLKANNKLVLDTRFFDKDFKARLIASIENFDEQCDGLLETFGKFSGAKPTAGAIREQIKCAISIRRIIRLKMHLCIRMHTNTLHGCPLLANGLYIAPCFMTRSGVLMSAIDDTEHANLKILLSSVFGDGNYVGTIAAEVNPAGQI